ncbi:uncharacterized protein TNCV_950451 [Trichonephila clavipes]|nr:uncharacterized protein TNCV_950451 [Trichonephila clavipes]
MRWMSPGSPMSQKRTCQNQNSRLSHNTTKTFSKLQQANGDSVLSKARVFRNFKAFSEGRESIEDESRSGRPSVLKNVENVVRLRDLVHSDLNRFLASKNIPVAPESLYSPDLSPRDLFLFSKLKIHVKGHHFGTQENIQTIVTDQLKAIPTYGFHQCYEEWKKRLQRCVPSDGSYFEGDNVEFVGVGPSENHDMTGHIMADSTLWLTVGRRHSRVHVCFQGALVLMEREKCQRQLIRVYYFLSLINRSDFVSGTPL